LESSRFTLQNEILTLNKGHDMTIFDQNYKNHNPRIAKAISTTKGLKIKMNSFLESSILTLQNKILILRTGHV